MHYYEEVIDYIGNTGSACHRCSFRSTYFIIGSRNRFSRIRWMLKSGIIRWIVRKRFFIYDLQRGKRVKSSYCMHGSGKGNTAAQPKFSNNPGSGCTSLGRYVMIGKGGMKFKNCVRLRGLDESNYLAEARGKNTFYMKHGLCEDCKKTLSKMM